MIDNKITRSDRIYLKSNNLFYEFVQNEMSFAMISDLIEIRSMIVDVMFLDSNPQETTKQIIKCISEIFEKNNVPDSDRLEEVEKGIRMYLDAMYPGNFSEYLICEIG